MEIKFGDVPKHVLSDATERTGNYLIGFVKLDTDRRGADGVLAGSGTLVRIGKTHGILTAQHVVQNLPREGNIGIIMPRGIDGRTFAGQPMIKAESMRCIAYPRGKRDWIGPDLALLILSPYDVSRIGAIKSFYNLSHWRNAILSNQDDPMHLVFGISGFPSALASEGQPIRGIDRVKVFPGTMFVTFLTRIRNGKEFDYADINVVFRGGHDEPPRSFQGFSGGGLWQIGLRGQSKETLQVSNCRLHGVAFYQSRVNRSSCNIRCHWRRSVYEMLLNKALDMVEEAA